MELPTRDTPPLRVRQLLSHSAGFPEDNPWGDQQLSATDAALDAWLRAGIPFSTPPGTRYEYSNYAFGLLGRIVTKASGIAYERYVRDQILKPLGMTGSTLEFSEVPAARRAIGYRLKPDGTYARRTAAAARRVRRDGRPADHRHRHGHVTWRFIFRRGRRATMRKRDR